MITFFHTADFHFGTENYGKIDPTTGIHSRLLDFKKSLGTCIDDAINLKADFFLFCGDAYKTASPSPTQQKLLMQLFFKLQNANIPVVIVPGNHDMPLSFGKAHSLDVFSDLPLHGFYVISKPQILKLETRNGPIQIIGMPWPTRHNLLTKKQHHVKNSEQIIKYISTQTETILKSLTQKLNPQIPSILAAHLAVSTGVFSGSEHRALLGSDPTLLPSQLAIKPLDYVALGHLHRHQDLNKKGSIPIVYSGSIEAIDFGEIKDIKGYCIVKIKNSQNKKRSCSYEFVKLKTRPMVKIECNMNVKIDQTEQLIKLMRDKVPNEAILKIVYHLPPGEPDKVNLITLQRSLSHVAHIASITPIHTLPTRQQRTNLNVNMSTQVLLEKYFQTKNLESNIIKSLLHKAQIICKPIDKSESKTDKSNNQHGTQLNI